MDVQASPGRHLPRRFAVQCRRLGLECRESAQAGCTAIRSEPGRHSRRGHADLASARKIDDMTVELTTKEPDSFLPINLTNLFMASPAKWQKLYDTAEGADPKAKSQAAWAAVAPNASGTGPWKRSSFTPRAGLELAKNGK